MNLIQSIPELIWAALLGSSLTLMGVMLTNRHHRAVEQARLDHESREDDKRRKFEARAEAYLAAAGEMAKAHQVLGGLASMDLSEENVGERLSEFTRSASQAMLIASDNAAEAINEYLSAFVTAFFHLLPRVFPIQIARSDRDIQDRMYQTHQSEIDRILATMVHVNETHSHDAVNWEALNRNLEFSQAQAKEAAEIRGKAWDEINRLKLEYMDEMMSQGGHLAHAALPALVAIRADLNISTDIDVYQKQLEKRLELVNRLKKDFISSLQSAVS